MFKIGDRVVCINIRGAKNSLVRFAQGLKQNDIFEIIDIHKSTTFDDDDSPYYMLRNIKGENFGWFTNQEFRDCFVSLKEFRRQKINKICSI